jgi:FAD/FMN-containing dehydrogenase
MNMTIQISKIAVDSLRKGFTGRIIMPGDPEYGDARTIFNAMIDRQPSVIAQCANADDVVRAILFGRNLGLEIAVRGGGHGVAGDALTEGGLVIDLRRMNAVSVDPEARTAIVAGGAPAHHLDQAAGRHGLATTGPRVATVGVGGFTLGGGNGWLDRKFGLACDNLVAVELVTADGRILRADDDENPELFWALHGGGGNFGVATSFTFRLHELSSVTMAMLLWRPEAGPDVLRSYRDFIESAPDEVGGCAFFTTGPAQEFVPEYLVGKLTLSVFLVYIGAEAEARKAVAPMLTLGHEGELITEMSYVEFQNGSEDRVGFRNYWSAESLNALPNEAINLFCAQANGMIVPSASSHLLFPQGGAVGRGRADYPVPWRHDPWIVHPLGLWKDPADDEQGKRWALNIYTDLKPWSSGTVALNLIGDEGEDRIVASYGRDNYAKLAKVKAQYDPTNVFHLNRNIKPA